MTDEHERRQSVGEAHPRWSDSLYFNAWDRATGAFLITRMAVHPNEPGATSGMLVWLDGQPAFAAGHRIDDLPLTDWDVTTIGPITYRMLAAGHEWVVQLDDGAGSLAHLTFTGAGPAALYTDGPQPLPRAWAHGHYEQVATVRGDLVVRGERIEFDGLGIRDHSWGLRQWDAFERWDWIAFYADGVGGNVYSATVRDHTGGALGFVTRHGATVPVASATVRGDEDDAGHPVRTELSIVLVDGSTLSVIGDRAAAPLLVHPDPHSDTGVHEVPMTMRVDGHVGFGIHELLRPPRVLEAPPQGV